jgi:hypothetical protein
MGDKLSFEGTDSPVPNFFDYTTPLPPSQLAGKIPTPLTNRVEDFAQTEFLESDSARSSYRTSAEIRDEFFEMVSQHTIEIPETELARRVELEKMYDEKIKDQPAFPGKLSTETLTKEEWVEMRLGLERKLSTGLLHRVNQAAKIVGKGLVAIENRGMKGAILEHPYQMEAILVQHPMGDTITALEAKWLASEDTMNFGNWLQANHPEVLTAKGVEYFSEEDWQLTALCLNDNGAFMIGNTLYNTANERVGVGMDPQTNEMRYKNGVAMYVVGPDQTFHATSQVVYEKHHSSILAGGAVIGAGECKIENGELVMISNKSGHYKPSKENMLDVLRVLQRQNVQLSGVKLELIMPDNSKQIYQSAQEFLDKDGLCLPEKIFQNKSVTTFQERVSTDGTKKLTVSFKNFYNMQHLQSCAEYGWNLSEVEVRYETPSGNTLVYGNAERFLEQKGRGLPSAVHYGSGQELQIIPNEQEEDHAKKLIFSPSTTPEQLDDLIQFLRNQWINIDNAEFQIGEEGEVKSIQQHEDEKREQILKNLGIEGEIEDVDDADD